VVCRCCRYSHVTRPVVVNGQAQQREETRCHYAARREVLKPFQSAGNADSDKADRRHAYAAVPLQRVCNERWFAHALNAMRAPRFTRQRALPAHMSHSMRRALMFYRLKPPSLVVYAARREAAANATQRRTARWKYSGERVKGRERAERCRRRLSGAVGGATEVARCAGAARKCPVARLENEARSRCFVAGLNSGRPPRFFRPAMSYPSSACLRHCAAYRTSVPPPPRNVTTAHARQQVCRHLYHGPAAAGTTSHCNVRREQSTRL